LDAYYSWHASTGRHVFVNEPAGGGNLQVEVHAEPGDLVGFVLGVVRKDLHIPGIGRAGRDPGYAVAWPGLPTVPPARAGTLTLPVPADPALRGVNLWAQSIAIALGGAARLANLWPISIR